MVVSRSCFFSRGVVVSGGGSRSEKTWRRSSHRCDGCRSVQRQNVTNCPKERKIAKMAAGVAIALSCSGMDPCLAESTFTPGTVEVGWEIYFGAAAGVVPFIIGAWEFGKRIVIQRRCGVCEGSGLVEKGRFLRKCPECGGFFPWQGWGQFFSATASPGNGGVLRQPRGQTSVLYKVPARRDPKADDGNDAPMSDRETAKKADE
ncbi:hypothetical protein BSKO_10887 [Bryopsis sp. KO-2023]|nr:hypothetical protein BSKO_10887 [Bryopsis sp. KO-2023]